MKKHANRKSKNDTWFIKTRGSYLPVSLMGWLTYVPFILFLAFSLWAVQQHTNNILGGLFDVIPYWVSAAVIMHWIGSLKS